MEKNVAAEIGAQIRYLRKLRHMSMEDLAKSICKTRSTVSKYENGQIAVDVVTLYDIANALNVNVFDLMHRNKVETNHSPEDDEVPAFFRNVTQLHLYFFDGRVDRSQYTVIDIFPQENHPSESDVLMYMNVNDPAHYKVCESTFHGKLNHYGTISNMLLQNDDMPMDLYQITIPSPYMDADYKWVLTYGISCRPLMPSAAKRLLSKRPMDMNKELIRELKISKEDIRLMKHYNMFVML